MAEEGRCQVTRVCAWCKTVMGYTAEGQGETHGICEPCAVIFRGNIARGLFKDETEQREAMEGTAASRDLEAKP